MGCTPEDDFGLISFSLQPSWGSVNSPPAQVYTVFNTWKGRNVIVADAPAEIFDACIAQVVEEMVNVDRDQWDIFERWHIINACLEADVLLLMELPDGRLMLARPEEEEMRVTASLAYNPEAGNVTPEEKEV